MGPGGEGSGGGGSDGLPRGLAARLGRKRGQARAVLWVERLWPAAWPAASLAGGYGVAALLGGVALLPPVPHAVLTLAVPAGIVLLLWRGARTLHAPGAGEVDRRLEAASGLRHRPLQVLADRPAAGADATGSVGADPVWRAHLAWAASQLGQLRVGAPRSVLAGRDLRALRGLVLVGLAASLVVAGPEAGPRLAAAFTPALPPGAPVVEPVLQAWITPPPSTGLAPVFLHPATPPASVTVPSGSKLQVSLTGGSAVPSLSVGEATQAFAALGPASWQAERVLDAGGLLSVRRGGGAVASWTLVVVADEAPVVAWAAAPGPAAARGGQADARTRLPWQVSHRYGVAGLAAELTLDARPGDPASVVAIPLPGAPKEAHGVAAPDLTANPWAGMAVSAVLVGRDGQGLAGRSEAARFVLPERAFANPLARALIAARRRLTLDPEHRDPVVGDLRGLAGAPGAFGDNLGTFLGLSTIATLLSQEEGPRDAVAQAQARLWEMALALDAGAVERTARVVEQAREQVRQSLDAMKRDPGAKADPKRQAELKARVEAMRQAIKDHLQAMLEQARKDGTLQPKDEAAQKMDAADLDRMLREMEESAKQGRVDDAEAKMEQLQKQMQALDDAAKQSSQQAEQDRAGKAGKGGGKEDSEKAQTAKDAVQDLLKREGGLLDTAQGRGKDPGREPGQDQGQQAGPGGRPAPGAGKPGAGRPDAGGQEARDGAAPQPGPTGGAPGSPPGQQQAGQDGAPGAPGAQGAAGSAPPRDAEGRVQRAMRRALGELMQQFGDSAGSVPKSLGDADQAMQQAEDALKAGHDDAAREAEQRAVADLRKGGQEMGQTMQRQFGLSESKDGKDGQDGDGKGEDSQDGDGTGGSGDKPGKAGRSRKVQRDPLGRLTQDGGHGISDGDDVHVPDQAEQARSRDLQDELRRRGADRGRPQDELDYIGRLLKPF